MIRRPNGHTRGQPDIQPAPCQSAYSLENANPFRREPPCLTSQRMHRGDNMVHIAFVNVVAHLQILVYVLHIMHLVGPPINTRISSNGAKALIRNHARTGEGITRGKPTIAYTPRSSRWTIWVSSGFSLVDILQGTVQLNLGGPRGQHPKRCAVRAQDSEDGFVEAQRISTPLNSTGALRGSDRRVRRSFRAS